MYEYFATYVGLRDGDTVYLVVDPGFYLSVGRATGTGRRPYRFMRVNAWELRDLTPRPDTGLPRGPAAKQAVDDLCRAARVVRVQTFKNKIASGDPELTFDRWLAEMWVDDVNVSDWIVANGHGEYKTY